MAYQNKDEAMEAAADMALQGQLPTTQEVAEMLAVGVDYKIVHSILTEAFYNGEELDEDDA